MERSTPAPMELSPAPAAAVQAAPVVERAPRVRMAAVSRPADMALRRRPVASMPAEAAEGCAAPEATGAIPTEAGSGAAEAPGCCAATGRDVRSPEAAGVAWVVSGRAPP